MRSKNFTFEEVVHRVKELPKELYLIGYFGLGYLQGLRDALTEHYKKDIPLKISSGYRSKEYNSTLENAAPNSYHIWRYEGDLMVCAWDIIPVGISVEELAKFVFSFSTGETYIHQTKKIVHLAPNAKNEEFKRK